MVQLIFLKFLAFTVNKYCKIFWKLYLKIRTWKKVTAVWTWKCDFATQQAKMCKNVAIAASQMQAKLPARVNFAASRHFSAINPPRSFKSLALSPSTGESINSPNTSDRETDVRKQTQQARSKR